MVQVFSNVLQNAAKFTKNAGQIRLRVDADQESAVISVRDTGIGMRPEHLEKVFDLFEQVDESAEGLGIGLALVRQIVSMHGGTVQALSDGPGTGHGSRDPAPCLDRNPGCARSSR